MTLQGRARGTTAPNRIWHYLVALALVFTILAGMTAWVVENARREALVQAEQNLSNIRAAAETGLSKHLDSFTLSLQGTADGLALLEGGTLTPEQTRAILFDASSSGNTFGSIIVLDRDGFVRFDSRKTWTVATYLGDREFFLAQRFGQRSGVFVSAPVESRLSGDCIIVLSRRLSSPTGEFDGVVAGSVKLSYFDEVLKGLKLGSKGAASVFLQDGTVVARMPNDGILPGQKISGLPVFQHFPAAKTGSFRAVGLIDKGERIFAFGQLSNLPMVLSISVSVEDVLLAWHLQAKAIALLLSVLTLAGTGLAFLFWREADRRVRAERTARDMARQHELLSLTDALTGASNRRHFDATLGKEWARHQRSGAKLSLLMIDVDFFKAYNDTYGHSNGDAVLRLLATCIKSSIRAGGDLFARYGGEEFAVILPETGADDALCVARRIHQRLQDAQLAHRGSPLGVLAVSIGVADASPSRLGGSAADLLEDADAALYRAKHAGRNSIDVAARPSVDNTTAVKEPVG